MKELIHLLFTLTTSTWLTPDLFPDLLPLDGITFVGVRPRRTYVLLGMPAFGFFGGIVTGKVFVVFVASDGGRIEAMLCREFYFSITLAIDGRKINE